MSFRCVSSRKCWFLFVVFMVLVLSMLLLSLLSLALQSAGAENLMAGSCRETGTSGGLCTGIVEDVASNQEAEDDMGLMQVMKISSAGNKGTEMLSLQIDSKVTSGAKHETCTALKNEQTYFTVSVEAGTPRQRFELVVDTGSNALMIPDCLCKDLGYCRGVERCFNTENSSTFDLPTVKSQNPGEETETTQFFTARITYGSGTISSVIGTDIVTVADVNANMNNSLFLMEDRRELDITGSFEGILPLGLPGGKGLSSQKSWAEAANVSRFSVCFNSNGPGKFSVNVPELPDAMTGLGKVHWGLDLQGMSVGNESAPVLYCSPSSKNQSMDTACGAIPDSGSTFLMGPQEHIVQLTSAICDEWPRCKEAAKEKSLEKHLAFYHVLKHCGDWLTEEHGVEEVPSIFIHVAGKNGVQKKFPLPPTAFIVESTEEIVKKVTLDLFGIFPFELQFPTGEYKKTCLPAMDKYEYNTIKNGPVWILGNPLFYEYTLGYDVSSQPPAISILDTPCTECDPESALISAGFKQRTTTKLPRRVDKPMRRPSIIPSSSF